MRKTFSYVKYDDSKINNVDAITTDTGRTYKLIDGDKQYPSITTIMSWYKRKAIKKWRDDIGEIEANKITKYASFRGSKLHDTCEKYLLNEEKYTEPTDYLNKLLFNDIKRFLDNHVDDIYCLEGALYSDHLGVAGRTDVIARVNGKLSIIDFKTSKKIKRKEHIDSYFMQATAYAIMFEELTGIPVPYITIIIAIDNEGAHVFHEKRNNFIEPLLNIINEYKSHHPNT